MYLGGFTHRDELYQIAVRWLQDQMEPDDAWHLTEIFSYEGFISTYPSKKFITSFLSELYNCEIDAKYTNYKHQVKESVIRSIPQYNERIEMLVRAFKARPEEYFPRAPFNGLLYYDSNDHLIGMYRIKRARRVAEKVSRRLADRILSHIRSKAESLAKKRATLLGIPLDMLLTSHEQMVTEFEAAERQLAEQITKGEILFDHNDMAIHDVIGIKVIGDQERLKKAEQLLESHPDITIVEREEHKGTYNATNIQVDLKLPPSAETIDRIFSKMTPPFPVSRGISLEDLIEGFPTYVETGLDSVRLEIILTTYEELVESEIGRSIHERRTLGQRQQRQYTGRIAKNCEFIIEYLLSVAFSPKIHVSIIPVKLLGYYLPETISYAIRRLYNMEESALFPTLTF
ncbi:hypothetical protein KKF84_21045 [Myxococcota bacterium]|nr:hypothetical protein [Myxococcota bacterium]MBU1537813.1 hypothetical protein [Myxococcota bacterium]